MKNIIAITKTKIDGAEVNSVNSRELYEALGLAKGQYSRWVTKNLLNDDFFELGIDYIEVRHDVEGNMVSSFVTTIDTAKHLSMMSRTKEGKEVRDYFIAVEKEANKPMSIEDMIIAQAQSMIDVKNKLIQIENRYDKILDDVTEIVEKNNPQEVKPSISYLSVGSFMSRYGMSKQTVMKVVAAYDPRTEECTKFVDGVGISEYQAYNRTDMDYAVKDIMKSAKQVSKHYYTSKKINGRFQCSLV